MASAVSVRRHYREVLYIGKPKKRFSLKKTLNCLENNQMIIYTNLASSYLQFPHKILWIT
ncbi:hypothetical protein [Vibrio gallaecicus]|uniref:hypothetical protein n=1 Tax=Vibrio gallaecicus TaxID=552386 RepID=UPI0025B3336B|nr:hypothetical protein [Vibrio gallaecicus]MDN3615226.1 hypothetical protein [Vibrio gallaecicus]